MKPNRERRLASHEDDRRTPLTAGASAAGQRALRRSSGADAAGHTSIRLRLDTKARIAAWSMFAPKPTP